MAHIERVSQPVFRLELSEEELGVVLSLLGHTGSDTRSPRVKSSIFTDISDFLGRDYTSPPLPYDLVPHEKSEEKNTNTMVLIPNPDGRL